MSKTFLLTSIGSRGDVQPLVALGCELMRRGHKVRLCVAPNFKDWVESFGLECAAVGPDLRKFVANRGGKMTTKITQEQKRAMAESSVRDQFRVMTEAARGCDLILVGGMLQTSGRSIAEWLKIPYVYASYCAVTLPSPDHAPPKFPPPKNPYRSMPGLINRYLWRSYEKSFDFLFGSVLNEQRKLLGLTPVEGVARHVSTDRPLLAADAALGPAGRSIRMTVRQTGAWFADEETPLPKALEDFLNAGEPPIYFGFGSMGAPESTSRTLIEAGRALGKRMIVSSGWGELKAIDDGTDCISIGDVNHRKLFPRVAAVVHHGGAGTTSGATRGGAPQVIVPVSYDQFYWAQRIKSLGLGAICRSGDALTRNELISALQTCLSSGAQKSARSFASRIELNGTIAAADRLLAATI